MWAITKKEFKTMFYSPIGYVIVAMFLIPVVAAIPALIYQIVIRLMQLF